MDLTLEGKIKAGQGLGNGEIGESCLLAVDGRKKFLNFANEDHLINGPSNKIGCPGLESQGDL